MANDGPPTRATTDTTLSIRITKNRRIDHNLLLENTLGLSSRLVAWTTIF